MLGKQQDRLDTWKNKALSCEVLYFKKVNGERLEMEGKRFWVLGVWF